jgi:hypothetical protein
LKSTISGPFFIGIVEDVGCAIIRGIPQGGARAVQTHMDGFASDRATP